LAVILLMTTSTTTLHNRVTEFNIRIQRAASYVEVVDTHIVASTKQEALDIANAIGEGKEITHPTLRRYNIWEREPVSYEVMEIANVPIT